MAGIQVNHCKTPGCKQFGIAPLDPGWDPQLPGYKVQVHEFTPTIRCLACDRFSSTKSNHGIAEELERITVAHHPPAPSCPTSGCENQPHPAPDHSRYHRFGTTTHGSARFRCKRCKRTFTVPKTATVRQRRPELNEPIFRKLVNKAPMRRLCEELEISPAVLYNKIDYIHRQCVRYSQDVERRLEGSRHLKRLYLSSDRQDYVFNWGSQFDRTNVTLHATGTADNISGYVFGMHLDFDPDVQPEIVEKLARAAGDLAKPIHERKFARLFLLSDYDSNRTLKLRVRHAQKKGQAGPLSQQYAAELARRAAIGEQGPVPVEEQPLEPPGKLPPNGMQVRSDYSMFAHFHHLQRLIGQAGKVRFFMDMDPGILSAAIAAFRDKFKAGDADAFYIKIMKQMTVQQKKNAVSLGQRPLSEYLDAHPEISRAEARHRLLMATLNQRFPDGKFGGSWIAHPFPDMSEPDKQIQYCTDQGAYDADHLARLLLRASLHAIDRYFMLVRRRINMFERPIRTSNRGLRSWYGYQGYNPAVGAKLLEIFRIYYNCVKRGEDGKTPAMRLGIAGVPATYGDVLQHLPG